MNNKIPTSFPPQHQNIQPGLESLMTPEPIFELEGYNKSSNRLKGKVSLITGGDSGIGRAVSLQYAKEGSTVCIIYYNEHNDANETKRLIESIGGKCLLYSGDIGDINFCKNVINNIISRLGKINIFISNAGEQHISKDITDISYNQLHKTFRTNFFGAFYLTQQVIPQMTKGDSIIYTTSITAYTGYDTLIDYSCTKGALTTLTRSLAKNLVKRGIRVNAVAPGPIWTPLIPSSFSADDVSNFGHETLMGIAGQPVELAEAYVFLASNSASYITGQTIHVNGGEYIST